MSARIPRHGWRQVVEIDNLPLRVEGKLAGTGAKGGHSLDHELCDRDHFGADFPLPARAASEPVEALTPTVGAWADDTSMSTDSALSSAPSFESPRRMATPDCVKSQVRPYRRCNFPPLQAYATIVDQTPRGVCIPAQIGETTESLVAAVHSAAAAVGAAQAAQAAAHDIASTVTTPESPRRAFQVPLSAKQKEPNICVHRLLLSWERCIRW